GEWSCKYRKLAREVERLKLAREASLVEQDVSNDLERRLRRARGMLMMVGQLGRF
ncbi:hypothetical protein K443DRAFT_111955, partial [Laccaria amethystina LaAM-08-1]